MHIAIDVRTINPTHSGVGFYVSNLLGALREIDKENSYSYVCNQAQCRAQLLPGKSVDLIRTPFSHENHLFGDFWEHAILPYRLNRAGVDVFHGPAFLIPFRSPTFRTVVTVHDLVVFLHPETVPRRYSLYMQWLVRMAVKRADRIIAVSECTRLDLMNILGVDSSRIVAIPEAAGPEFAPPGPERIESVLNRYKISGRYLLHVGNLEPKKNLPRVIRAFDRVARMPGGEDLSLVIAGKKGWLYDEIFRTANGTTTNSIRFLGYVPRDEMAAIYAGASCFVFPSIYEGFGLPVLEAMACGTPVVTSNISSMPEVAGGAAVLVDPYDEESIASGILAVVSDPSLQGQLRREGILRSRTFSWDRAARETLDLYRDVYNERH
ncbi:MAG: glycosyltransferase family 4 protein [Nitrospirae bacterium]|nr:glycosyltransferase family 4 protein [Nitrospirota bacterium]